MILDYVKRDPTQFTLDRIDNSKGHTIENVVVACWGCNKKRSTCDSTEFNDAIKDKALGNHKKMNRLYLTRFTMLCR